MATREMGNARENEAMATARGRGHQNFGVWGTWEGTVKSLKLRRLVPVDLTAPGSFGRVAVDYFCAFI